MSCVNKLQYIKLFLSDYASWACDPSQKQEIKPKPKISKYKKIKLPEADVFKAMSKTAWGK